MTSEIDDLLNAATTGSKLKTNTKNVKEWNGRINMFGVNKISPEIRAFIELEMGETMAGYAKRALIKQLKSDGFTY
jgi:hypothetical protein